MLPRRGGLRGARSVHPTAVVSSTFTPAGQEIVADITLQGALTTLANVPLAPLTLTGTLAELLGGPDLRHGARHVGADLTALTLTGSVFSHALTVTLDPASPSTGETSIVPVPGQEGLFGISGFFDVFVELTLDGPTPLQTTRNVRVDLVPAPTPLALLLSGFVGLAAAAGVRERRRSRGSPTLRSRASPVAADARDASDGDLLGVLREDRGPGL